MDVYIVCPYQQTDGFSLDVCWNCSKFYCDTDSLSFVCRAQRSRSHKQAFKAAHLTARIGIPDKVIVESTVDSA